MTKCDIFQMEICILEKSEVCPRLVCSLLGFWTKNKKQINFVQEIYFGNSREILRFLQFLHLWWAFPTAFILWVYRRFLILKMVSRIGQWRHLEFSQWQRESGSTIRASHPVVCNLLQLQHIYHNLEVSILMLCKGSSERKRNNLQISDVVTTFLAVLLRGCILLLAYYKIN